MKGRLPVRVGFFAVSSVPELKPFWIPGDVICAVVQLSFSRRKATVDATRKHGHLGRARVTRGHDTGHCPIAFAFAAINLRRDDNHVHGLVFLSRSSHLPFPPRRVCRCSRRPGCSQSAYHWTEASVQSFLLRRMNRRRRSLVRILPLAQWQRRRRI